MMPLDDIVRRNRETQRDWIIKILNANFRCFSAIGARSFPAHEFDADESRRLMVMCKAIERYGYARVFSTLVRTEKGRVIIDTAAGYGEFAETAAVASYLGVFIAAESFMSPFALPTYELSMIKSACYERASPETKRTAMDLIHLARFVRGAQDGDDKELLIDWEDAVKVGREDF